MTWHLVTGEYPPGCGGVGDHTRLLAGTLVDAGQSVEVWAPSGESEPGIPVHAVGAFHGAALRELDRRWGPGDPTRVMLVQYAPQAFGRRGMNLAFCRWVARRANLGDQVRVIFHEPYVQFGWRRPLRNVLAAATRLMARRLLAAARRSYVSVPAWAELLRPLAPSAAAAPHWLPVGSTIPVRRDAGAAAAIRATATGGRSGRPVVGHFGTYGRAIAELLEPALAESLERSPDAVALLVGRGSERFVTELTGRRPHLSGRIHASSAGSPEQVSHALQAFDVALQPYPDGATSRRTTLMAVLEHGIATATHQGMFSEPFWREAGFAVAASPETVGRLAAQLLADAPLRRAAAAGAAALYRARFSPTVALDILLDPLDPARRDD